MAALLAGSRDVGAFLNHAVERVAEYLAADVCSIYLFDEEAGDLVLEATRGLSPDAVGKVRLKSTEGLVGLSFREMRPVLVNKASEHPEYRLFSELGEEPYDNFLASPIQRGLERVGTLVVQRAKGPVFSEDDGRTLRIVAAQLAGAIENARVFLLMRDDAPRAEVPVEDMQLVHGQAVSDGMGIGWSRVLGQSSLLQLLRTAAVEDIATGSSVENLDEALRVTIEQLEQNQKELAEQLPEMSALIFMAHLMMLKDAHFVGKIRELAEAGMPAEAAVIKVARKFVDLFERSPHDYMREKAGDVEDVAVRILRSLAKQSEHGHEEVTGRIAVARELFPSDMLMLSLERVQGIVLTSGGATSHVAILARSLDMPLVIANDPALRSLPDGTTLAVDGHTGNVYIRPDAAVCQAFVERKRLAEKVREKHQRVKAKTKTRDGQRVRLLANINLLSEVPLAVELKAEGVGLYRTEFPFLVKPTFPTREEQQRVYRRLIEGMKGKEVTFRTLDVGGDKVLSYYDDAGESNPALGLRSLRFTFSHPDVFRDQVSAMLLAAEGVPIRIMFPMVASLDDIRRAKEVVEECRASVAEEMGRTYPMPAIGVMIEIPSVVEVIEELAQEVSFFSIGTNDFIQYMLAVDRTNDKVADLYCAHHPAVLRALRRVVDAACAHDVDVSVCGEMAHDPIYVRFFIGVGVRAFSVDPHYLPDVQESVFAMSLAEATAFAERLLAEPTVAGTSRCVEAERARLV